MRRVKVDNNRMLNLKTGKFYLITSFNSNIVYIIKVKSKRVKGPKAHVYICTWSNPGTTTEYKRYFWDDGNANQGKSIGYAVLSIRHCSELTEDEAQKQWIMRNDQFRPNSQNNTSSEKVRSEVFCSKRDVVHEVYG